MKHKRPFYIDSLLSIYLVSLYSKKKIFISTVHCTVRETSDSLEVNLSFLFCRKEL